MFCPHCGEQSIWKEQGAGDSYVGISYLCLSCQYTFTIQGPNEAKDSCGETYWSQRLAALEKQTGEIARLRALGVSNTRLSAVWHKQATQIRTLQRERAVAKQDNLGLFHDKMLWENQAHNAEKDLAAAKAEIERLTQRFVETVSEYENNCQHKAERDRAEAACAAYREVLENMLNGVY